YCFSRNEVVLYNTCIGCFSIKLTISHAVKARNNICPERAKFVDIVKGYLLLLSNRYKWEYKKGNQQSSHSEKFRLNVKISLGRAADKMISGRNYNNILIIKRPTIL